MYRCRLSAQFMATHLHRSLAIGSLPASVCILHLAITPRASRHHLACRGVSPHELAVSVARAPTKHTLTCLAVVPLPPLVLAIADALARCPACERLQLGKVRAAEDEAR